MNAKLFLAAAATWVVAVPFVIGGMQSASAPEKFDVASVKLNKSTVRQPGQFKAVPASGRLTITDMLVRLVIQGAYGLQSYQLVVADKSPVLAQKIDIEAKTERTATSGAQLQQMLQPLLAERFKLAIHRESRNERPGSHPRYRRTAGIKDEKKRSGL